MNEALRPMLELAVVVPAAVLCFLPMGGHLKGRGKMLALLGIPALLLWAAVGGAVCYAMGWGGNVWLLPSLVLFALVYQRLVDLPAWKPVSVFFGVCGVFACLTNLATAADIRFAPDNASPWFSLAGEVTFNLLGWLATGVLAYPATHASRRLLSETEMPGTWYVFWILPVMFIGLNVAMQPLDYHNMVAGRLPQMYPIVTLALLVLLLFCYLMFYLMARGLASNLRLQQENQLLQMQTAQYEALRNAIAETRQARHDLRHHFDALSALAVREDWDGLLAYLASARERVPADELNLCDNPAVDGVAGYYAALLRREGVPFSCVLDLPRTLPVAELDVCVVLSNLLENAMEASLRMGAAGRAVSVRAEVHGTRLVLLRVENRYQGVVQERDGVFLSSKRSSPGVGLQSVQRIAQKNGGYCEFTHADGTFRANVMLRGAEVTGT